MAQSVTPLPAIVLESITVVPAASIAADDCAQFELNLTCVKVRSPTLAMPPPVPPPTAPFAERQIAEGRMDAALRGGIEVEEPVDQSSVDDRCGCSGAGDGERVDHVQVPAHGAFLAPSTEPELVDARRQLDDVCPGRAVRGDHRLT